VRKVFHESLVRDTDVNLLSNIEISIQVEIDLSLFREMEIQITGDQKDGDHVEDNEKSDLGLQSDGFLGDPLTDEGSDPLDRQG
jgi:hypothetical protein